MLKVRNAVSATAVAVAVAAVVTASGAMKVQKAWHLPTHRASKARQRTPQQKSHVP